MYPSFGVLHKKMINIAIDNLSASYQPPTTYHVKSIRKINRSLHQKYDQRCKKMYNLPRDQVPKLKQYVRLQGKGQNKYDENPLLTLLR